VRDRASADGESEMVLLDEPSMGLAPQIVEEVFGSSRT
jgi:ABC-type branched-subunit amino acid transport system ATPase component